MQTPKRSLPRATSGPSVAGPGGRPAAKDPAALGRRVRAAGGAAPPAPIVSSRWPITPLAAVGVAALLFVALLGLLARDRDARAWQVATATASAAQQAATATAERQAAATATAQLLAVQQTAVALARPTGEACARTSKWLDLIVPSERAADYATAAKNARAALNVPDLCPEERPALVQRYIDDAVKAVWQRAAAPGDREAQRQVLDELDRLRAEATDLGGTFPSPRAIAEEARARSWFLAALKAWEEALRAGEVSVQDRQQIRFYYANLHDLGTYYSQSGTTRDEGLALLVAAHRIDVRYGLGDGRAGGKLTALLGPDEGAWPAPIPTSLLP